MAYTIKRKPVKAPRRRNAVLDKIKSDHLPASTAAVREGAQEVTEKLRADISRWTRVRRAVSLKPTMGCIDCDTTGKVDCAACGGGGNQKIVWNDEIQQCQTCAGTGQVTCSDCMGHGEVENVHRKKLKFVLVVGGIGWAYILFRLWGGDVLPEQQAKYITRGGGGSTSAAAPARGSLGQRGTRGQSVPAGAGGAQQPGVTQPGTGQPSGVRHPGTGR